VIVFDASVLIAQLDARDAHHRSAIGVFVSAGGSLRLASPITLGEVLVAPIRRGTLDEAEHQLRLLDVNEQPFGGGAARRLAGLRAATGLRLPDCCVLLAAQDAGADAIATFDDRLAEAARGLGLAVAGA